MSVMAYMSIADTSTSRDMKPSPEARPKSSSSEMYFVEEDAKQTGNPR